MPCTLRLINWTSTPYCDARCHQSLRLRRLDVAGSGFHRASPGQPRESGDSPSLNGAHIHGTHVPVEEPSTASKPDFPQMWLLTHDRSGTSIGYGARPTCYRCNAFLPRLKLIRNPRGVICSLRNVWSVAA